MTKRIRIKNSRAERQERIKEALAKKPTANDINSSGLTPEQIKKMFKGGQVPQQTRRIINQRGSRAKKNFDPKTSPGIIPKKTEFVQPASSVISMPEWFQFTGQADVSVIVPLFKSHEVIKDQIASWDLSDEGIVTEIIYVNDFCPRDSYKSVIESWQKRQHEVKKPIGSIVMHAQNGGFGAACNTGAKHATGKYILFLNADCTVTSGWIRPMYDMAEADKEIGMVGNMQLKKDNRIDSAGSQWSWKTNHFEHIGRNTYNGKSLSKAISLNEAPEDLMLPGEREMVTGCCFLMPQSLFQDLEGFDTIAFRIGYWEDSDLCMRVRSAGYKIMYQPDSRIYHAVGHSKSGGHPYYKDNVSNFRKRWIDTGRIDSMVVNSRYATGSLPAKSIKDNVDGKVVGCVIACNEEEFLAAAVDSASPIVDEWVFVIGGNEYAHKAGMCDDRGYPTDNTLEIAHDLAKNYNGKVIEPPSRLWKDKVEMRNAYVEHLQPGNWMFMLDGDEVYKEEQLWKVTELMKDHEILIMQFWCFWNDVHTIGTGKWDQFHQERVVRWHPGFGYKNKNHLHVSAFDGRMAKSVYPTWKGEQRLFYHYSWVRPIEKIRQKLYYYKHQSGNNNDAYVDDVFLKWREDPNSVEGKTHPMGGGGFASFPGIHPKQVQELIDAGKLSF